MPNSSGARRRSRTTTKDSMPGDTGRSTKAAAARSRPATERKPGESDVGAGGELHQTVAAERLTTEQGLTISDDQNSLTVGVRGPVLLEDFVLREKVFHFDHERIPERVVHARGYGAHGFFETYESLRDLTSADVFARAGEQTPVFVRFSTVAGNKGSVDLARDVRGFAVKFYTKEGNWDLVGNNIPVFFIQDAIKFPDLVHAAKEAPDRAFPQAQTAHDNFWDFVSLLPESTHMLMWTMSDRAIPRSFRFMEGFGVHTFRFVDDGGVSTYVKFHWKPMLGLQSVVWNEAVKINGADPDFHRRDLWDAIERGAFPEWELGVQVFDDEFADAFEFDVLDATKLIPEERIPIRPIGRLVLNRTVDNFFAETEQVAFCTSNVVRGIDFTNDPLLQGRNFSYLDTQLKRLGGPNFAQLPINAPKCPVAHFQQDGQMAFSNPRGRVNYEPNSWNEGPREDPDLGFRTAARPEGGELRRVRPASFADHFSQARQFYASQTAVEQGHIVDAFVFELSKVQRPDIRARMVANLRHVDESLATAVAAGLGTRVDVDTTRPAVSPIDLPASPRLSIIANPPSNFGGRKLGVLVTDGSDAKVIAALTRAATKAGVAVEIVAPTVSGVVAGDGSVISVDHQVDGAPSVLFDAVVVLPSPEGAATLSWHAPAIDFLRDAHAHCKFIGYGIDAEEFVSAAGLVELIDSGYTMLDAKPATVKAFIEQCAALRFWEREPTVRHRETEPAI